MMREEANRATGTAAAAPKAVLLVGNPNVGKSVIMGWLTRKYVVVSNYPGTTVEVTRGTARAGGAEVEVIDTPGVNSLIPMSDDERVTRDILLAERNASVVQVADAKNLGRALNITVQLAEMGLRSGLVVNMMDEAGERRITVDLEALEAETGIPVVGAVATRRSGLDRVVKLMTGGRKSPLQVTYPAAVEKAVSELEPRMPEAPVSRRSLALMVLAGDASLREWLKERVDVETLERADALIIELRREYESVGYAIQRSRAQVAEAIAGRVVTKQSAPKDSLTRSLGRLTMHPVWGWPALALALGVMYLFVGRFGAGTCVDFMEHTVFGKWVNPSVVWMVRWAPPLARDFLVGPYGLVTMAMTYAFAIVLPIVGTFFLFFGLLEDSGYLPRLAVMVNRVFRSMGMNGKAVLPMVLGLGCGTMATMTTRILGTKRERLIVTLLLALGVPCSAQLGVILAMLAGISTRGAVIWGAVVLGVLFVVGWAAGQVLPGEPAEFVMEVPPMRLPVMGNIAIKTLARMEWYVREAVPLFLMATVALFVLDRLKLLGVIENAASPIVVHFLGLPKEAAQAFIVGFLRRDYGAAGLFMLARQGAMDHRQVLVSLVTMTLFVPCIAHFFMMTKERGLRESTGILVFTMVVAILMGGALNFVLTALKVTL